MKKIFEILFIFSIGVLLFTSCEQEINEYDLIDLGAAATTPGAATVEAVGETSCTIIITPNEIDVRTYYVVLNDSEETPDQYAVINASADVVASGYFVATVIENDTITVSGLDMEMVYDIYTFAVSETGVASAYSSAASVTTFDATGPSITAYSPAGGSVVYDMNQNIVLTFSEDITYDATKEITLFADYASYSEVISEENIVVDGNTVTILHSKWPYEDFINLTIEEGAFVDANDNVSAAIVSYPGTPNYWIETGLTPPSQLVGNWTVTETSIYGGGATYDVTITAGDNNNELVISSLWNVFGAVIPTTIELDQETGNVTCPEQFTGFAYSGDPINAIYSNAFSLETGVYGQYDGENIWFDAKLYAGETGIFDQVHFVLVPTVTKNVEINKSQKKELSEMNVDIKERF